MAYEPAKAREQIEGLKWCEAIDVDFGELLNGRVRRRRRKRLTLRLQGAQRVCNGAGLGRSLRRSGRIKERKLLGARVSDRPCVES